MPSLWLRTGYLSGETFKRRLKKLNKKPHRNNRQDQPSDLPTQQVQPDESADSSAVASAIQAYSFAGPLPHPSLLESYGRVLENAPERILAMAEKEAANRQGIERWIVKGDVIRSIVGVIFAFIIGISTLGLGAYLVLENHDIAGTLFAGAGLTSLVSAFIYGTRHLRDKEKD